MVGELPHEEQLMLRGDRDTMMRICSQDVAIVRLAYHATDNNDVIERPVMDQHCERYDSPTYWKHPMPFGTT